MACPAKPFRPVRPTRWMKNSNSLGISKLITWETPSISIPLAAKSVATTYWYSICWICFITRRRSRAGISPWMVATFKFFSRKNVVTSSAFCFVFTKINIKYGCPNVINSNRTSNGFCVFVTNNWFVIVGETNCLFSTWIIFGFPRYFLRNGLILSGIVAENTDICKSFGILEAISSTVSKKPKSKVMSASSTTIIVAVWTSRAFSRIKSKIRPGVPMTIWGAVCCNFWTWRSLSVPPTHFSKRIGVGASSINWEVTRTNCSASSRLGTVMTNCNSCLSGSILWISGNKKLWLFPLPVWDWPITDSPFNNRGIIFSWILVGVENDNFSNAVCKNGCNW